MRAFSIHAIDQSSGDGRLEKVLSIYLHQRGISVEEIDGVLSQLVSAEVVFDRVHFVGQQPFVAQVTNWLSSESVVRGRLEVTTTDVKKAVRVVTFDTETGTHTAFDIEGGVDAKYKQEIAREAQAYLQEIFRRNNGLMVAPKGFHYVKPSGRHVSAFLRASNVFEEPWAHAILVFWLLPYVWRRSIREIVVDTSGILGVAIELARCVQHADELQCPAVWSHQSYEGLSSVRFAHSDKVLILISASTSGGLREELISRGAVAENIVTLFSLAENGGHAGQVLCNLTKHTQENPGGFETRDNYIMPGCPLCASNSFPVRLTGDQFSFEPPKVDEVPIVFEDLSDKQRIMIDQLAGTGFFKVLRRVGEKDSEIFLDVSVLFNHSDSTYRPTVQALEKLEQRWKGMVLRGAPLHLRRVIPSSYPFSSQLAELATGEIKKIDDSLKVDVIAPRELRSVVAEPESASLVVTACMNDAQELMGINRDLRAVQPHGNTTYISPVFRTSSKRERGRIKSNLTFGENGPGTFSLFTAIDIELPECANKHSWAAELHALRRLVEWADLNGRLVPAIIHNRIGFLEKTPASGASDGIFWPDPNGAELKVRPDFTFIETANGTRIPSQADIFVVVSSVLHKLRAGVPGKPKLSYTPYERAVLSPDNFQRFNDGVIHAAVLRAARGYELSYSNCDDNLSERMRDFLLSQISRLSSGEGEALMEFLIAILTKRLVLRADHTLEIANNVRASENPEHFCLVAEYLVTDGSNVRS